MPGQQASPSKLYHSLATEPVVFFRGLRLGSQHQHGGSQPFVTITAENLTPSSGFYRNYNVYSVHSSNKIVICKERGREEREERREGKRREGDAAQLYSVPRIYKSPGSDT